MPSIPVRFLFGLAAIVVCVWSHAAPANPITVFAEVEVASDVAPRMPERPVYYTSLSGELYSAGVSAALKKLTAEQLDVTLSNALSRRGYVLSSGADEPSLVVEYRWGDWTASGLPDRNMAGADHRLAIQRVHLRASIAGGRVLADGLKAAMLDGLSESELSRQTAAGPAAIARSQMRGLADPVASFRRQSVAHQFIVDQAVSDCYFVIVSAYSYNSKWGTKGKLAWRTSMTVATRGIPAREAIPMLIEEGSRWYGIATEKPEIIAPPVTRKTR